MKARNDTIAAIATPPGQGGIGVVRVSGPGVASVARGLAGVLPTPRRAHLCAFRDHGGQPLDRGLLLYFPAPHSFTGEDVLEVHGHGGRAVMDLLLARAVELGARHARPGEFTERAFLNGKIDLAQAEAVADLIAAGSAKAARAATRSLEGEFSARARALGEQILRLRTWLEATLDFPDDDIDAADHARLLSGGEAALDALTALHAGAWQGNVLRDGLTLVLAGRPNAGKSSLLNALARRDSAIVSDQPGTTRDVLHEQLSLDGMPVHVLDTAGLRPVADAVEGEGVRRARAAQSSADRILLVVDDNAENDLAALCAELPPGVPYTIVRNKIDLSGRAPGANATEAAVSARTGQGLADLEAHLKASAGYQEAGEGAFTARRRHVDALARAGEHLERAVTALRTRQAPELAADDLAAAHAAIGELVGEVSNEELLASIFSTFCIGK